MYTIDFLPVIILAIFIGLYNPVMTTVFVNQRFSFNDLAQSMGKRTLLVIVFIISFFAQFIFFLFKDPSIWLVVYFITITALVIGDRIAKRIAKNKRKQ